MIGAPDDNYRPSNYYCRVRGTSACGNVGAVNILYGTTNGLNAAGDQFFNQNSSGIEELAQTGDEFGAALSLGDLNSDGFLDLVIGAPVKPSTVITTLALPTSSTATLTV